MSRWIAGIDEVGRAALRKRRRASPNYFVGIDEVGRGPLAGPVTVAAVATQRPNIFRGLRDSKRLSSHQRQALTVHITSSPKIKWAVVSVGAKTIDRIGIVNAAQKAVAIVLGRLVVRPKLVMLDGSFYAPEEFLQCTVIKGDEQMGLIAAASIIAKVTRDAFMQRQHVLYPEYGFAFHKGYGTAVHYAALRRYGPSTLHRKSFL